MKKKVLSIVAVVLVLCCAIGGTLAWLTDKTGPVKNTFTVGDINIDLGESDNLDLKMVPGKTITKDPFVKVEANSEACWLFVKVVKSANFDGFMTYAMADGWTQGDGKDIPDNVFYREVPATTADVSFNVLSNNQVQVLNTVTKTQMENIKNKAITAPTLTFTAYAVQSDGITDVTTAWAEAQKAA